MGARVRIGAAAVALGCVALGQSGAVAATPAGFGKDAWWYKAMGLGEAHKVSTGKGVTIGVIDGPIDPTVPELRGQDVTPVISFCGGKPTGTAGIAEHATTIAVNIVGSGKGTNPGGVGVVGIAPDATVRTYSVDDSPEEGLQCSSIGTVQAEALAIDAAVRDGARLLSISYGGPTPDPVDAAAVKRALDAGVVVVAAAGNGPEDKAVNYPAAYPGVVTVAAVDSNAKPWVHNVQSNREAFVISAPGVEVATGAFDGKRWRSDALVDGTSEAAPIVAGGLALVAAKYPKATGNQLIQHLIHNPGGTRTFGRDLETGYGIISVTKMLASDPTQWPDVNPLLAGSTAEPAATNGAGSGPVDTAASPVAASAENGGGSSAGLLLGGGLAALLVVGAGVFVMSRRRAGAAQGPGGGHG